MKIETNEEEVPVRVFERQIASVMEAIKRRPERRGRILTGFISNFFDAVKETLKKQGRITPVYIILADTVDIGVPPVTQEVLRRAKEMEAEGVVSIEGFESENDITDIICHVSLSAPGLGVLGWVLKVKQRDGEVLFKREMPYLFDTQEKVKTLGELVAEMERE